MRILGIDPSYACTGFAIVEDMKLLFFTSVTFEKKRTKKDKREVLKQKIKLIENRFLPDKILIERIRLYSRGFISTKVIIALGSLISTVIDSTDLDVYSVDSRSFKSKVVGNANCSKEDVINWVKLIFNISVNEDQADAIAIAWYPFMDNPLLRKENN